MAVLRNCDAPHLTPSDKKLGCGWGGDLESLGALELLGNLTLY